MNPETAAILLPAKELRVVRQIDKRAQREAERFDHAIAQYYREWLWKHLVAEGHTPNASEVGAIILEMRRVVACEKKASQKRKSTWQDTAAAVLDVVGDLPPIIPVHRTVGTIETGNSNSQPITIRFGLGTQFVCIPRPRRIRGKCMRAIKRRANSSAALKSRFLNQFFPYQRDWLLDGHQFKLGLWARQTGKDFTCAAEAVVDCIVHPRKHWLILACGERQAVETLLKAGEWVRKIEALIPDRPVAFQESSTEIRFENGSRITALPTLAETVRGYSANIVLTEFAFHDDADAISIRRSFPA